MNSFISVTGIISRVELVKLDITQVDDIRDIKQVRIFVKNVTTEDGKTTIVKEDMMRKPLRSVERIFGFAWGPIVGAALQGAKINYEYSLIKAGEMCAPYEGAPEEEWFEASSDRAIHNLKGFDVSFDKLLIVSERCDAYVVDNSEVPDVDDTTGFTGGKVSDEKSDTTDDAPKAPRGK